MEPKFKVGDAVTSQNIITVKSKILEVFVNYNNGEVFYICEDEGGPRFIEQEKLKPHKEIVQMCEKHNERMAIGSRRVAGIIFSICRSCHKESELSHAE